LITVEILNNVFLGYFRICWKYWACGYSKSTFSIL